MSNIRLALAADKPAIETIVHDAYTPYITRIGHPPGPMLSDYTRLIHDQHVYVVDNSDGNNEKNIQGVLVLIPEPHDYTLLLDNIAVAPSAQGTGLGRKMLAFAHERAAADDKTCRTLRLYTNQAMTENVALYSRLGFVETHRGEEDGFKRVYMAKEVNRP